MLAFIVFRRVYLLINPQRELITGLCPVIRGSMNAAKRFLLMELSIEA
jgi:hypothetical protein